MQARPLNTEEEASAIRSNRQAARKSPQDAAAAWRASAAALLIWLPPGLMAFYLKWYMLAHLRGFANVAHALGRTSLTSAESLSLFRGELLVGFLLLPLIFLLLNRYLSRPLAVWLSAIASMGSFLLLAVQLRALKEVGRYISLGMMRIALGWGLHEPGSEVGYVSIGGLSAAILTLFGMGCVLAWSFHLASRRASQGTLRSLRIGGLTYLLFLSAMLAVGFAGGVPSNAYQVNSFHRAFAASWERGSVDDRDFASLDFDRLRGPRVVGMAGMSQSALISDYRSLAHVPAPIRDPRYFGKERGDNVLFIILETTPDEFLPADGDWSEFPNFARLRAHAFVGLRHYTTLPFTASALFSVFSSWYPLDSLEQIHGFGTGRLAPGVISQLNALGYESAVFSPLHRGVNHDGDLYDAVGFSQQSYVPNDTTFSPLAGYASQPQWKTERIDADLYALHSLKAFIDRKASSGHPFVAAFVPQIGHFPYPDLAPDGDTENLRQRGRAILQQEDGWVGQLLDVLSAHGSLQNTLIVVLGDHGRRTILENPNLRRGTIDETAFHVPAIIYAPRALDHMERIRWITSHIDVAPSILDLLGVESNRDSEQGSALWDSRLQQRKVFLLGYPTFGADGYASSGRFFMRHNFDGAVYANSQALFDEEDFVLRSSPIAREVKSSLSNMIDLESAWHQAFALPASSRSSDTQFSVAR